MKMKKTTLLVLIALISLPALSFARSIDPFVSAAWLEQNLSNPKIVVLDVRKVEDYKAGHIPGAVNSFFAGWAIKKGDLQAELPEIDDLTDLIIDAGISQDSIVVVVESEGAGRYLFAARVAWTLAYMGLTEVTILDGGHAAWVKEGKAVAKDAVRKSAGKFTAKVKKEYKSDMAYVVKNIGKIAFLDARSYDTYFGRTKLPFVSQYGHIPGATSLPKEWLYDAEGKLVPKAKIEEMLKAVGLSSSQEIITYCDTGMGCVMWWWVIHEYLGWTKISSYDGSSEQLTKNPAVKYTMYNWK